MSSVKTSSFTYSNVGTGSPLSISSTGGVNYCIKMDASGNIIYFEVGNSDMWVSLTGTATDPISEEDVMAAKGSVNMQSGHTVTCGS